MNRVLFEASEMDRGDRIVLTGRRAHHVTTVLKPSVGDVLRIGVIDGPRGMGEVMAVGKRRVELACSLEDSPPPPASVDVILAVPRPKVMRRLWAPLASLGVGRIILANAEKVEQNYFDTHWLNEETYRPLLIEGLEQSGDTRLPSVEICRRLKPFVEDRLDDEFPHSRRLICHPRDASPLADVVFAKKRVLVSIGPEGGWSDYEIDLFALHGFECVSLGWRTLRTDVACMALIAVVNAALERTGR
jgi:16S rRNA (uracil1498-N3)-methyltransferase